MKWTALFVLLAGLSQLWAQSPPAGLTIAVPVSTNAVTNATVYLPVGTWTNAVVYDPPTSLTNATVLMWDESSNATTNTQYRFYFGNAGEFDKFHADTGTNRVAAVFGMSTDLTYFFYVTSVSAEPVPVESDPSNLVIIRKTR